MTINREATIRWKGYDPNDLSSGSGKKVWANCDICGKGRWVYRYNYTDLCHLCGNTTDKRKKVMSEITTQYFIDNPEAREAARLKSIEQWSSQDNRDKMSEIKKQFYIDNPEAREEASKRLINRFSNLLERDIQSNKLKQYNIDHPEEAARRNKNQIRGNDIIQHHYLYDDANLSKYTMPMTRSEHGKMHARMRADGYEVLHINSDMDDNGLWGYSWKK